jgi:serine/threonine-protein kinase
MAFGAGSSLGSYEILALLGAGGMGEVYRAKDTKLGRDVALKILPASFTIDPERVARFRREAQVLASLNHPHIAQIYGLEEANGTQFLVLELVDGESLDKRIARGPIPVDEALGIAKQIAEALEAAHEKGIIHRDLKPANIVLTIDGNVKVLDFGLAKAVETTGGSVDAMNSPTITSPAMMTGVGVILGTAAYMAPEQAKGRAADKRSDIWAFGCVLYEMLTSKRAFDGDDVSDTLAAVLKGEPDWTAPHQAVPQHIRLLIRRCLEKDRAKRLADVSIARFVIDEPTLASAATPATVANTAVPHPLWKRAAPIAITAIVVAAVTSLVAWRLSRPLLAPVVRFPIVLPEAQQFARRSHILAVSPDGARVVYAAAPGQLYLRSVSERDAHPIEGTNLDVMNPFFSPDGQWIGFYSFKDGTLKKIPVSGGAPVTICKADPPYGATWDGESIVFADQGTKGILKVSENGGQPEIMVAANPGEVFAAPQILDSGKTVLYTLASAVGDTSWDQAQIVTQAVGSTARNVIVRGGSEGQYVSSGHLVYMVGETLVAMPVDRRTRQARGAAVPMIETVRRFSTTTELPSEGFVLSASGSLVYVSASAALVRTPTTLSITGRDGKLQPLGLPPQLYRHPRIAPDGRQLAVETDDGKDEIIWIYDLRSGGPARRLTFGGRNRHPIWTRDGRRVTFQSDRDGDYGIFWQLADGTRPAERLSTKPDSLVRYFPESWSPDDKTLAVTGIPPFDYRLFALSSGKANAVKPLLGNIPALEGAFSPDGKWLAYASTEISRRREIFVQPFPPTGAKYQVSTEGGTMPLWSPDGSQLYWVVTPNQRLVEADVRTEPTFSAGKIIVVPIDAILGSGLFGGRNYDLTPDGKQFVVVTSAAGTAGDLNRPPVQQIEVVLNWAEELKTRVSVK